MSIRDVRLQQQVTWLPVYEKLPSDFEFYNGQLVQVAYNPAAVAWGDELVGVDRYSKVSGWESKSDVAYWAPITTHPEFV